MSESRVHPSAVIDPAARIGDGVRIGPFCAIGPNARIGDGCELLSHVVVEGYTTIGERNRIFPFASIGHQPQDLKYHGEASEVIIGDDNTIREGVTINPGTEGGGMLTKIGSHNLLMAYSHVAHDCLLGNQVILANGATLAGHVEIEDGVILGGHAAVLQFVRIGRYAMIGGTAGITKDVPPFCLTSGGYRPGLAGLNLVGLRRRQFSNDQIKDLKSIYRLLFQASGSMEDRLEEAGRIAGEDAQAMHLLQFVRSAKRGILLHRRDSRASE